MIPVEDLTSLQRDTLIVIRGRTDASGVEIIDELEDYYDEELFGGRLYPSLDDLVDKGLVAKTTQDGRTNAYSLTDEGQRLLEHRIEWQARHLDGT